MKSLNKRKRALEGKTDYYHRGKMIRNYDSIVRLRLGKKCNYFYTGLYLTQHPAKADLSLGYMESRWLRKDKLELTENKEKSFMLGYFMGKKINLKKEKLIHKKLILDLGRQKKIQYQYFVSGLSQSLDSDISLVHGLSLKDWGTTYQVETYSVYKNQTRRI